MSPYREPADRHAKGRREPATWPAIFVVLLACPMIVWIARASRWELGVVVLIFVGTLVGALLKRRA